MNSTDAKAIAYTLLRQVKGKSHAAQEQLFSDPEISMVVKALANTPSGVAKKFMQDHELHYNPKGNPELDARQLVLTLADAWQFTGTWDWLYNFAADNQIDETPNRILGTNIKELLNKIDSLPMSTLTRKRDIKKSLAASFYAMTPDCIAYALSNPDCHYEEAEVAEAYTTRVNTLFMYVLDINPIFEEENLGL